MNHRLIGLCAALVVSGACDATAPELGPTLEPGDLCSEHPSNAVVTFADQRVTQSILESGQLGEERTITCELARAVLWIETDGARSLSGVQNLSELKNIVGGPGGIEDLSPVAELNLHRLDLPHHQVSDLRPLAEWTELVNLDLSGNPVELWPELDGHGDLWLIVLRGAGLTSVPPQFAGLPRLSTLDLSDNALRDFSGLLGHQLSRLDISGNGLTQHVTWSEFHASVLDISRNPLADLGPLAAQVSFYTLVADSTEVRDLGPLEGRLVGSLSIDGTGIADLSSVAGLRSLRSFSASGNEVVDISPLASLEDLVNLGLAGNEVTDISPLASLEDLGTLVLAGNGVTDVGVLERLTDLNYVDLSNNPGLVTVEALIRNPGFGPRRYVSGTWQYDVANLRDTNVPCHEVIALRQKGANVSHHLFCPE